MDGSDSDHVSIESAKQIAKEYYEELSRNPIKSPAFDGENVEFRERGWLHILGEQQDNRQLSDQDVKRRLKLLPKVKATIKNTPFVDEIREKNNGDTKEYGMLGRFEDGDIIRVVVEEERKKGKTFYSVFDWEDVSKKIKRLSLSETSSYLVSPGVDKAPSDQNYGDTLPLSSDLVKEEPKYSRRGGEPTTSLFPEVEKRIREAKGVKRSPIKDKAKELLGLGWQEMTRHFPHLDPKTQGKTIEVLRQFQEVPVWSKQKATDKLDEFIGKLSPDDRHVFGMNLILADMLRDLDSGLLEPHPEEGLPFGYKDRDQVQQDYDHFSEIADQRPEIREASKTAASTV
ncbi:MAG: hypothetical protein A4E66_01690 [Syntrophus sp. PtaB.Bin001]|nr:MAG: hypothetical protein A4E66_01690 [Syntrophus sp. PtaB.Bin001]